MHRILALVVVSTLAAPLTSAAQDSRHVLTSAGQNYRITRIRNGRPTQVDNARSVEAVRAAGGDHGAVAPSDRSLRHVVTSSITIPECLRASLHSWQH